MKRCAYQNCKNNTRVLVRGRRRNAIKFIPFPKPKRCPSRCLKWIELCGNQNLNFDTINKTTYICSEHFDKNCVDPKPYCNVGSTDAEVNAGLTQPSLQELPTVSDIPMVVDDQFSDSSSPITPITSILEHSYSSTNNVMPSVMQPHTKLKKRIPNTKQKIVQVYSKLRCGQKYSYQENYFSYKNLKRNTAMFRYFTGLNPSHFEALYSFLDENVMNDLKYQFKYKRQLRVRKNFYSKFSNRDKLCLVLVRLRRGYTLQELTFFCNTNKSYISVIFFTWVQFMYHQIIGLRGDLLLASRNIKDIPYCFKYFEDKILGVMDATEISLQMARNFRQQGNTYSSYKHTNTIKFLVVIAVSGAIIYCSEGFEGSISDSELFAQCDIRNFLQENDCLLADRGFLLQDLANELKIKVITPPFLLKRDKLTAEEERLTKKIAKSRVHVERAIRRIKLYRILSNRCPITMLPIISNIFSIVCFLVNFEKPLVK